MPTPYENLQHRRRKARTLYADQAEKRAALRRRCSEHRARPRVWTGADILAHADAMPLAEVRERTARLAEHSRRLAAERLARRDRGGTLARHART